MARGLTLRQQLENAIRQRDEARTKLQQVREALGIAALADSVGAVEAESEDLRMMVDDLVSRVDDLESNR